MMTDTGGPPRPAGTPRPTAVLMITGGTRLGTRSLRLYLPLSLLLVLMLFPFYWMLITSIKPNRELYSARIMPMIVYGPLKHYINLLTETNFLTWTYNTFLVAIVYDGRVPRAGDDDRRIRCARINFPAPPWWPWVWRPPTSSLARYYSFQYRTSSTSSGWATPLRQSCSPIRRS